MATFVQMATVPFNVLFQRPQQIMSILSKKNLVYYIENKPGTYKIKKKENLNLVGRDFNFSNENLIKPVILWCSWPGEVVNIDKIPHDLVIYDILDDSTEEFSHWANYIEPMLNRADLVFTTATDLYDKYKYKHSKVYLINNGLDSSNFSLDKKNVPLDMPTNKKIVGYVGAIATWMDWKLINYIVKNPKYNFVFVGPFYERFRPNIIRSNVYFLGNKEYSQLPYYINNMDCCIIPFKVNNMTNSCNPIKLYEYMSLGKPVVTTNMKEIYKFSSITYISKDIKDFKENIDKAVNEKNKSLVNERIKVANNNSWQHRIQEIGDILRKEFNINIF